MLQNEAEGTEGYEFYNPRLWWNLKIKSDMTLSLEVLVQIFSPKKLYIKNILNNFKLQ